MSHNIKAQEYVIINVSRKTKLLKRINCEKRKFGICIQAFWSPVDN